MIFLDPLGDLKRQKNKKPAPPPPLEEPRLSPEKDIALATLDNVILEAETSLNIHSELPAASQQPRSSPNKEALAVLDDVIQEAEDDLGSSDDYETKVESDLEEAKDDTIEDDSEDVTTTSSVTSDSRPRQKSDDLEIIDLEDIKDEDDDANETISSTSPNANEESEEVEDEDDESVTSFPPPISSNKSEVIVVGADTTIGKKKKSILFGDVPFLSNFKIKSRILRNVLYFNFSFSDFLPEIICV